MIAYVALRLSVLLLVSLIGLHSLESGGSTSKNAKNKVISASRSKRNGEATRARQRYLYELVREGRLVLLIVWVDVVAVGDGDCMLSEMAGHQRVWSRLHGITSIWHILNVSDLAKNDEKKGRLRLTQKHRCQRNRRDLTARKRDLIRIDSHRVNN